MNKYQLVYKLESKTHHTELQADSYQSVRDVFDNLMCGELVEIREILHTDTTIKKDDGDYFKYAKVSMKKGINLYQSMRIPKIKKSNTLTETLVKNLFTLEGIKPDFVQIQLYKK
uniref:hypothetical protein n=1 Tax=Aliarcobacter sp. TaxID=2321116 RepID=UPI0040488E4F